MRTNDDAKQFISYKNKLEGVEVNGFLDENSFCGNLEMRMPNGLKLVKSGVFKRVHTFKPANVTVDFAKYLTA